MRLFVLSDHGHTMGELSLHETRWMVNVDEFWNYDPVDVIVGQAGYPRFVTVKNSSGDVVLQTDLGDLDIAHFDDTVRFPPGKLRVELNKLSVSLLKVPVCAANE